MILLNLATVTLLFERLSPEATLVNNDVGELPSILGTYFALRNFPESAESSLTLNPEYVMKKSEYVSLLASNIITSLPVVNVLVKVVDVS